MILKSLSRKSNGASLIAYVLRYSSREKQLQKDTETVSAILRKNLRSRKIENIIREFKENESFRIVRRRSSVLLFHEIISFNPGERHLITDDVLKKMAKRYTELRGQNNLYLITVHRDTLATHMHAVCSGVSLNGRSSRVSKQKFRSIKLKLERFQREKFPQLVLSHNNHEKKARSKEEIIEVVKKSRQTHKQAILSHIEQVYSKAISLDDFSKQLATDTFQPYFRGGRMQGIVCGGKKYRLSRLGFDIEKLQKLDSRAPAIDQTLPELQEIRAGKHRKKERTILASKEERKPIENQQEYKQLQELAAIRKRFKERAIEKDTVEETTFEREIEDNSESIATDETAPFLPLKNRLVASS